MWGREFPRLKNFDVSYQVWGSTHSGRTLINVVFRGNDLSTLFFAQEMCKKRDDIFAIVENYLCFFPWEMKDANRIISHRYSVFPFEEAYLLALCSLHEGRIKLNSNANIRSKFIPRKIREKAFPLQIQAIQSSFNRSRILNFSEMGVGKSLITLGSVLFAAGKHMPDKNHFRVLIVCPSYLCSVWAHEVKTWTNPKRCFITKIAKGCTMEKFTKNKKHPINFFVMSYSMMVRNKDFLTRKGSFDAAILDEAHYIKNPNSKRFKAIRSILCRVKSFVKFLYILTGTPVNSCYSDLYPLFALFRPDIFMSFGKRRWLERYSDLHQGHFGLMSTGAEMPNEIRMLIKSASVRLETKQVSSATKDFVFRNKTIKVQTTIKKEWECFPTSSRT